MIMGCLEVKKTGYANVSVTCAYVYMFESMRSKMVSARDDSAENYRGKRGAVQREDARECYSFCFGQKNCVATNGDG